MLEVARLASQHAFSFSSLRWNCCTPLFATKMHPTASRTTGCTLSLSLTHTHTHTHTHKHTRTHAHTHTHIHRFTHTLTYYLSLSLMFLGLLGTKYGCKEHNHQPSLSSPFLPFSVSLVVTKIPFPFRWQKTIFSNNLLLFVLLCNSGSQPEVSWNFMGYARV